MRMKLSVDKNYKSFLSASTVAISNSLSACDSERVRNFIPFAGFVSARIGQSFGLKRGGLTVS